MSDPTLLDQLVAAIVRQEHGEKKVYQNHNPGNIWDGLCEGKIRRIWPEIPIDAYGFLKFQSLKEGMALLRDQINYKVIRGATIRELVSAWAPAKAAKVNGRDFSNHDMTEIYIGRVAAAVGLAPDIRLRDRSLR